MTSGIDERRAEVAVRAGAEEAGVVGRGAVARGERAHLVEQLQLGERVGQVERGLR